MLDKQELRKNLDEIVARLDSRDFKFNRTAYVSLEEERKSVQTQEEKLKADINNISNNIRQLRSMGQDSWPHPVRRDAA